jgi:hypothetical protein
MKPGFAMYGLKHKMNMIIFLSLAFVLSAQECGKYKVTIDSLMTEFNTIKDQMNNPDISRDEYDDLNSMYTAIWSEVVESQKMQKKCIESQKKTVKVKVEPKRVDSNLPALNGVKWGSSRQQVKDILRNDKSLKLADTDDTILEYHGGDYMGNEVEKWQFSFNNRKLYACQIILKDNPKLNALKQYEKVSSDLKAKYGEPGYDKNRFPSSYKDDKIKISSIKNGSVTIYNKWLFKRDDTVRVGINETGSVMITYLVEDLYKKAK